MFDIAREALAELDAGRSLGVVVVTRVHGSAPRAAGAAIAVTADGRALGSLSGGCVESEAYDLAERVLASGEVVADTLGASGDLYRAALACGGALDVIAVRVTPAEATIVAALRDAVALDEATLTLGAGTPAEATLRRPAAAAFVIVGAVDFTRSLADGAVALGYRVTVADHRAVFATAERFPGAHRVLVGRPASVLPGLALDERAVICVMTHDRGVDVEALRAALATPAAFIGAMGSRRAHDERVMSLREAGVGAAELARVRSPIGLDLGGSSPAETAVAILAEVIAARTGGGPTPLTELDGPIHVRRAQGAPADGVDAGHASTP